MKLRYVGHRSTTFVGHGLTVDPGQEFDVPDDAAPAFLSRSDVEKAPLRAPVKSAEPPATKTPAPAKKTAAARPTTKED